MDGNVITQGVFPIALFVLMLGMGLTLEVADFRRIATFPRAFVLGVLGQLVVLPLVALGLVAVVPLAPPLAAGLLILGFCPGGAVSNVVSFLARGNVALSVSLTAVTSVITPFTLPPLTHAVLEHHLGAEADIVLPVGRSIGALVVLTLVPVVLGALIRRRRPAFAGRVRRAVEIGSAVVVLLAVAAVVGTAWAELPSWVSDAGGACLALNLAAMSVGYGLGRLGRLPRAETTTITVEVGIQNVVTALLVTGTLLGDARMSVVPVVYGLIMLVTSLVFVLRRFRRV